MSNKNLKRNRSRSVSPQPNQKHPRCDDDGNTSSLIHNNANVRIPDIQPVPMWEKVSFGICMVLSCSCKNYTNIPQHINFCACGHATETHLKAIDTSIHTSSFPNFTIEAPNTQIPLVSTPNIYFPISNMSATLPPISSMSTTLPPICSMSTTLPSNISTTLPSNISTKLPSNISTTLPSNISTTLPSNISTTLPPNISTTLPPNISTVLPPISSMSTTLPPNISTTLPPIPSITMTTQTPLLNKILPPISSTNISLLSNSNIDMSTMVSSSQIIDKLNNLSSHDEQKNSNDKKNYQYSAAEKETMVKFLTEKFPKIKPKVLYLSLRHYYFNMEDFFESYNAGKVNFTNIEKHYLLEEYTTIRMRLDEINKINDPENAINKLNTEEKNTNISTPYKDIIIPKPAHWDLTQSEFALIPVILHSDEGLNVIERFYESDEKSRQVFQIKNIIRVQNCKLFDHYFISKDSLVKRNGESSEKLLFHGCASTAVQSIVSTGFDIRMSNFRGIAGVGIYFSQFPRTSLSYIRDCSADNMQILLCRVELGVSTSISELHKAFPLASPTNPIRKPHARSATDPMPFDSVYGNMRNDPNHPIHIVYDNYQVLPEYIIIFAINDNVISKSKASPPSPIINFEHPRYKAQIQETKKSLKFLEKSLEFEPNKSRPDYKYLKLLYLLLTTPIEKCSIHDTEGITLNQLQDLVRYYNTLCANCPIILLAEKSSYLGEDISSFSGLIDKLNDKSTESINDKKTDSDNMTKQ